MTTCPNCSETVYDLDMHAGLCPACHNSKPVNLESLRAEFFLLDAKSAELKKPISLDFTVESGRIRDRNAIEYRKAEVAEAIRKLSSNTEMPQVIWANQNFQWAKEAGGFTPPEYKFRYELKPQNNNSQQTL